ncbi:DUF1793-domain-containing protein [Earliella scabrosa]|nr:DUF1793-domain-containing protein [Earliella scabrosa]
MYGRNLFASLIAAYAISLVYVVGAVPWTATPFNPAAVPLAVKSPYVSAWLRQGGGAALNDAWPNFWAGGILGWAGFATVDGAPYSWMGVPGVPGAPFNKSIQKSMQFTATQSVFVMTAGPVDITIRFLSPIEPSDLTKQSFPFSYYALSAASNDGQPHSVQVYADISGEWVSADTKLQMNWTSTTSGDVLFHELWLADRTNFMEVNNRIYQGSAFHATVNSQGTTYQSGIDTELRAVFINNTRLMNTLDTDFRGISDQWPVFAFAHDLGSVTAPSDPVVYAVGHVRDPVVQYVTVNGIMQDRSSYFWTEYGSVADGIKAFLADYSNALDRANQFDAQVEQDAKKISQDYADLVALSMRQGFGAIEITVARNGGSYDTSNVLTFLKEMSTKQISTVDAIYAAWPLFLYASPDIAKQLILPILSYHATAQFPRSYVVHDLGVQYPSASGHNDGQDNSMPVEECANMIIMALSYAQRANDTSMLRSFFDPLDEWGQYLVSNTLSPGFQSSTDQFAGQPANQTNLAIKGIIGLKAMAQIAALVGNQDKSSRYNSQADSYLEQWQTLATARDGSHLKLTYGDDSSWGLMYNLYADKLLGLNFIPDSVYGMQSNWYLRELGQFGVPLNDQNPLTKSDWEMFVAATASSNFLRDQVIGAVRAYAANGQNNQPLGDLYESTNGTLVAMSSPYYGRANVGGHLALMATSGATAISPGSTGSPTPSGSASPSDNGARPMWVGGGGMWGLCMSVVVVLVGAACGGVPVV